MINNLNYNYLSPKNVDTILLRDSSSYIFILNKNQIN